MAVRSRRKAREVALRSLYEMEIGRQGIEGVLKENLEAADLAPDLEEFARRLVIGVKQYRAEIDALLSKAITDWDIDRIAAVDRNVLRIATFELVYCPTIPPAVTIDEAVEIGRKYSTAESGRFVNGVLGTILKNSPKAMWMPGPEAEEETAAPEAEPEPEEITLDADSEEARRLAKAGGWRLKSGGDSS